MGNYRQEKSGDDDMDTNTIRKYLTSLREEIAHSEEDISRAIFQDLKKSRSEAIMTEVGMVLKELDALIKNLDKYRRPKRIRNSILNFRSKSYIYKEPWGKVLIVSPWNYPFNLSMIPLCGAIAAGNSVSLKPSKEARHTRKIIKKIISKVFPEDICKVLDGDDANTIAMDEKYDYIFFTGGYETGKLFYEKAARDMVPVTLELGGKSPVFVLKSCDLKLAAKRLAFGKFLNAGQTCVAADYSFCPRELVDEFKGEVEAVIKDFYGDEPINSENLGGLINDDAFNRILDALKEEGINAKHIKESRKIEPTVLVTDLDSPFMQREIFGPVLPIIPYDDEEKALKYIKDNNTPLAFYVFGDESEAEKIVSKMNFGGASVNDTISHMVGELPFGGMGASGIGAYHGKRTFYTFVHEKSVLFKKKWPDLDLRYPGKARISILKKIFKL